MEKGVSKHWTPKKEATFQRLLDEPLSFAERYMITSVRNLLKYDGRSRESKKATAKLELSLITATDVDLVKLAEFLHDAMGPQKSFSAGQRLEELVELRENIRAKGIPRNLISRGEDA